MSDVLSPIWPHADARTPRFSADQVARWPEGLLDRLAAASLVREVENAEGVICDACNEGHDEEVTLIRNPPDSPPRAYIYCPESGHVEVPLERLRQWAVDFGRLTAELAQAMDLAGEVEELVPDRLWFLGKGVVAGRSREFFFARGLTWRDASDVFGRTGRLTESRSTVVFVGGAVPPAGDDVWRGSAPIVVTLKTIVGFGEAGISVDREHLTSLLSSGRRKPPTNLAASFPTPPETTWADVHMVCGELGLTVAAKGIRRSYTFQAAGFEERRRKNVPDRLWALLRTFAMHGGVLPFHAVTGKSQANLKRGVSHLRERLAALLPGVEGSSIVYSESETAYKTTFRVSSDEMMLFPTPSDTSWTDVSIASVGDSAVRIAVSAPERFAVAGHGDAEGQWSGAEREGFIERTYDLRTLRLADDRDMPNRAGQALLAVLAGAGSVGRAADDAGMLDLCGVLTGLLQIEESPFRFIPSDERWVALFEAVDGHSSAR